MKISRAIVTGGAGFIGSHIVDELIKRGIETFVVDNLRTGSIYNLRQHEHNKLLHIVIGDAKHIGRLLFSVNDVDVVFHEAAIASVPLSVSEPMLVHNVNVNMTLDVMNFCLEKNIKRFIFASSAAVYGLIKDRNASEGMVCKPFSPYGASKLAIEDYLAAYHNTYGLETVALRYFNVFGSRQTLNDYSGVITVFTNQLLRKEIPTVHGDGKQVRDFVHVRDIVQANMLAMESQNAVGDVFNVASGRSVSITELLKTLKEITKTTKIQHKFGPQRPGDVRFGLADINKIKNILGYDTKITLKYGLAELTEFIKNKMECQMLPI
jgi:UDP-glucose 4-epimerase